MPAVASQIVTASLTIPAGTTAAAPASQALTLLGMDVEWIEFVVPPGPRGEVGFAITDHGANVIPYSSGGPAWIITDDEKAHWDLTDQPYPGSWALTGYNLGTDPHTIYVRIGLSLPAASPPPGAGFLPVAALSS